MKNVKETFANIVFFCQLCFKIERFYSLVKILIQLYISDKNKMFDDQKKLFSDLQ